MIYAALGLAAIAVGKLAAIGYHTARRAMALFPLPRSTHPITIPPNTSLSVPGITPFITPNGDFYRTDTALVVPTVDPQTWILRITGLVDHPFTLTYQDILALPLEESVTTLMCVSNPVGGNLTGNAT